MEIQVDEFAAGLQNLYMIHKSRMKTLEGKLKYQVSKNLEQEKKLRKMKKKVKRLKIVVSASKQKIIEQAAIISEQIIPLRYNNTTARSLSSDHTSMILFQPPSVEVEDSYSCNEHENQSVGFATAADETHQNPHVKPLTTDVLDTEPNSKTESTCTSSTRSGSVELSSVSGHHEVNEPPSHMSSPTQKGPCHVMYSHTHNTVSDAERSNLVSNRTHHDSSTLSTCLSLRKGGVRGKTRYKVLSSDSDLSSSSPSMLLGSDSKGNDSFTQSGSGGDLQAIKQGSLPTGSEAAGNEEGPLSCSMFASAPKNSTEELNQTADFPPKQFESCSRGRLQNSTYAPASKQKISSVDQIAEWLSTKEVPTMSTPPPNDSTNSNIVPVTPGVRLVNNILSEEDKWLRLPKDISRNSTGHATIEDRTTINEKLSTPRLKMHGLKQQVKSRTRKRLPSAEGNSILVSPKKSAVESNKDVTRSIPVPPPIEEDINTDALRLAKKIGLPVEYKCDTKILKRADRDKLDAKACPDCKEWFENDTGVQGDKRAHLRHTCRHKALHLPPDSDPKIWNISFPNTED